MRRTRKRPSQGTEKLFRCIFENAQIGIGIFDIQTERNFSNRAVHEMLGYSQKELRRVGQWDEIVHSDERASGAKRYSDLIQGKRDTDEWEQRFIRRDGRVVTANGRFKLIRDARGKPKYVVALSEDVTERRLAEAERIRVTKQMRLLLDSTGQGVYGLDLRGRCTFINKAASEMIGYRPEEVLGCRMHHLVHHHKLDGSPYPVEECPVYQTLKIGKGCRTDEEILWRGDGTVIPVEYSSFPVLEEGSIKGAVVTVSDIKERRHAKEALQSSERLFRSIFEGAQVGIGVFKIDTREHFSNRALHEMLGYTGEELSRLEQWDEIVPAKERIACAQRYAELVDGQRDQDEYEQHFVRRDGHVLLGNSRFQLLRDASGRPECVVTLTEDITERTRAKEALQASEELFRSVFENAQIGIGILDIKTGAHLSNRAQTEMLGYSQEELKHVEQWDEIVHPDDRATGAKRYAELVHGQRDADEYTQRFIRRDRQIVTSIGTHTLIRDMMGKPQYVVSLHEDITERLKAEEALAASERLFRTIFENAQIGISVLSVPSGQLHTNQALHEMLGCTHEDLSSVEKWDLMVHPDERASGAERYAELMAGKRDNDKWEQKLVRRDGRTVIANGRFSVIRDDSGKLQYVLNLTEDITERKQAEAELVTAKEAAVAATKAKSEFLANMSHEIRTPMNAILGTTYLALKTDVTPKQRDYLTKTKAAAQSLLGIINDILDFSKIEAGKLDLENTDFHLDHVLENLSSIVSQRAHERNLEFLVAAQPDLPAVLVGDPLRIGQVLINLVNNAVKFTEHGEIVVTVKVEERLSDRVKLKFAVRDSGIGMTPNQTARLFQAFSQADTSTTRKYGGTGLGLSISKRLVEMMEGSMWVESEYGRGTTFWFTAWFGVGSAERRDKILPPGLRGVRVLVVDDNAIAREILADMLRQFTVRVECVSSGNEALRELVNADAQDPYCLVFIDWQMPGLDGLETSRRIKRGSYLRNMPKILMITAFSREDISPVAHEAEIEGFLQKPVTPSALLDSLMSLFGATGIEKIPATAEKTERAASLANGVRVLLVEDNEVNQQVAKELLESEGAKVTIANHGAEAVKLLGQANQPPPFDVVLMDLQMPEMDGLTATSLLRAQPYLQQLPIIAMTAHVMTDEVQRCLEAGMNDHVAKPIDPEVFFATLARWTRAHPGEPLNLPPSATRAGDEMILPELAGVDVAAGLERTAGNKRLYRDLLVQFAARHESTGSTIREALESGDHNQAERLAHSLKGVAGNLGINQIFVLAGNLERAISESHAGTAALIEELTSALDGQIRIIRAALLADSVDGGKRFDARPAEREAALAAIARLRERLEASAADAPGVFAEVAETLRGTVAPRLLDALGASVKAFDFDAALSKLEEIFEQYRSDQG